MAKPNYFDGYLWAVLGAALPFGLFLLAIAIIDGNFEAATPNTLNVKLLHLGAMSGIFFVLAIVFIAMFAWIPLLLASATAAKWKLKGVFYFAGTGVIAGAVFALIVFVLMSPLSFPDDVPTVSQYIHIVPMFSLSGGLGGLCVWFKRRRSA